MASDGGVSGFDDVSLARLRERRSERWAAYPADVLPLFYAEMDLAPRRRCGRRCPARWRSGTSATRMRMLRASGRRSPASPRGAGVGEVDPGAVVAVPDVLVAVAELLQALTAPGDRVVITPPVYPPFFSVTAETGRRAVEVPLGRGGCPSRASGRRSSPARVLLLCNPHNPTEQVSRREELVALAEIAAEHDHPAPDPLSAVLDVTMHDPMRLSRHARNEMRLYRISEQDVEATMSSPSSRELDDRGNARLGGRDPGRSAYPCRCCS